MSDTGETRSTPRHVYPAADRLAGQARTATAGLAALAAIFTASAIFTAVASRRSVSLMWSWYFASMVGLTFGLAACRCAIGAVRQLRHSTGPARLYEQWRAAVDDRLGADQEAEQWRAECLALRTQLEALTDLTGQAHPAGEGLS